MFALAVRLGADSAIGAASAPTEPAVDVRLIAPVAALTLSPPDTLPVLMLPDDDRVIESVPAVVPTAPCSPREPVVDVSEIVGAVMVAPAPVLKLPLATTLNVLPAPELLLMLLVALLSLM